MSAGDLLSSDSLPLGRGVQILEAHPCGLIAFGKPAGALSHPNSRADQQRAVLTAPYDLERECYLWKRPTGGEGRLWLLNRLDSATSGVLLGATNEPLALAIRDHFKKKHVHKTYCALVFGAPSVPQQIWRDRLAIEKKGGQVRTRAAGNIPCESAMKLLRRRPGQPLLSLLQLEPRTGRSHQLRVQCALHGLPIVGDATYGEFGANRRFGSATGLKRLFLHSLETRFELDFGRESLRFHAKAPLPPEFEEALRP